MNPCHCRVADGGYPLVARGSEDTVVRVGDVSFEEGKFTLIAGPCVVEGREMIEETARFLSNLGVKILRGGTYKARTSPYSFQGQGEEALQYLRSAGDRYGMRIVTEVLGEDLVKPIAAVSDMLQVGSRNAQNFQLLKKMGDTDKPVLLKRGFMNTLHEFLLSAEYVAVGGNRRIILCERGIRTFETMTRNTLDISAVPLLKQLSHLPVIIDPSHAAGRRDIVIPLLKAAMAAGAQGAIVEVHPAPEKALCDGEQSLSFPECESMVAQLDKMAAALDIELA